MFKEKLSSSIPHHIRPGLTHCFEILFKRKETLQWYTEKKKKKL